MATIVVVAPSPNFGRIANLVLRNMRLQNDIPVVVGSDQDGCEKALKDYPNAKVFVTRGGTAKALSNISDATIVATRSSFFDIMDSIKKVLQQGAHRIAVVTHNNIIGYKPSKIDIGNIHINMMPCNDASEIKATVEQCISNGYDGIIGCVVAVATANLYHTTCAFIDSDYYSIHQAIAEALKIEKVMNVQELALKRMDALIDNIEEGVLIYSSDHQIVFINEVAQRLLSEVPQEQWFGLFERYMDGTHRHPHVIPVKKRQLVVHTLELELENNNEDSSLLVILQDASAIEKTEHAIRTAAYAKGLYARTSFDDLVLSSPIMTEVKDKALRFAKSDSTVLIMGETGVGKEGFAQSIHNASNRSRQPFVSVNCASLPQGLVASELFGYAEGAFTGARQTGKKGLFELAQGGTIFLDEITEIPLDVQAQFLRVLQEREVMRIGDDRIIPLNIRVICATNKNILPLCKEGKFRFDLYYRINVLKLQLPPLRERTADIVPLFQRFIAECQGIKDASQIEVEPEAQNLLTSYGWFGNVRELHNIAEICALYGQHITYKHVFENLFSEEEQARIGADSMADNAGGMSPPSQSVVSLLIPYNATASQVEYLYLKQLLAKHSIKEAVKISGLSRTTIWRRMNQYEQKYGHASLSQESQEHPEHSVTAVDPSTRPTSASPLL